jgi:hypothetical protein
MSASGNSSLRKGDFGKRYFGKGEKSLRRMQNGENKINSKREQKGEKNIERLLETKA